MTTESELRDNLEYPEHNNISAFPDEDGWEIALEVYKNLYNSEESKGVAKLADELGYEHSPIRHALTRAQEKEYLKNGTWGYEVSETGESEFSKIFSEK